MIRTLEPSDVPRLAEIHVFGWRNAYFGLIPDRILFVDRTVEGWMKFWNQRMTTPERTLVYDDGIVKGFCLHGHCREHSSTAYEVMALYVEPAFLRHGVGTALLEQTEVLARKKGNPEMVLWVLETNTLGRSFYEKQGYTPGGVVEEDGLREVQYSKKL